MEKTVLIAILTLISFSAKAQTEEQQEIRKERLEKRVELQEGRNPNSVGIRDTKLQNRQKVNFKKIEINKQVKASGREDELRAAQQKRSDKLVQRSTAQKSRNSNSYGNKDARLNRKSRVNERRLKY